MDCETLEKYKLLFNALVFLFAFTLLVVYACHATPVPTSYTVKMTSEHISIYVNHSIAVVEGIYTFDSMKIEPFVNEVNMFYPLPSNAQKIKVIYEGQDIGWKRSSLEYRTFMGKYSVIKWTVSSFWGLSFPFEIVVRYEYELPRENQTYIMLYAMGSVKLADPLNMSNLVYSKMCNVSINTYFSGSPKNLKAFLLGVKQANGVPVPDEKWLIEEGKNYVSRHEVEMVEGSVKVSTGLVLELFTMHSDYAIFFDSAEDKFAWIERLSSGKDVYMPGEDVMVEFSVKRGNDVLTVVYEAEIRFHLLVNGRDIGQLGSSHIEIPSSNGSVTATCNLRLPNKMDYEGEVAILAELWAWNTSLQDLEELRLKIVENSNTRFTENLLWVIAAITAAALIAIAAATLYRKRTKS
ncbi:MAG: hypothetical protein QW717_07475 [Candidatus Bathyarchaeia archaeon]